MGIYGGFKQSENPRLVASSSEVRESEKFRCVSQASAARWSQPSTTLRGSLVTSYSWVELSAKNTRTHRVIVMAYACSAMYAYNIICMHAAPNLLSNIFSPTFLIIASVIFPDFHSYRSADVHGLEARGKAGMMRSVVPAIQIALPRCIHEKKSRISAAI